MSFLPMPDIDLVHELLIYSPDTGLFFWNVTASNRAQKGNIAGSPNSKGYVSIKIQGKKYRAHRIAWFYVYGEDPGLLEIDHKDRNKANNKIENLRLVTRKQNNENVPLQHNNTSGIRGVSYDTKGCRWTAYIYHNKRRIHLGSFGDIQRASEARFNAELSLFTHSGITKDTP